MEPITCSPENAPKFLDWIRNREGLAHWSTVNLFNPGEGWCAPVISKDGTRLARPHSYAASEPDRIVTSSDDILVVAGKEVKRFHIAVERHGMALKLTGGATRRVHAALDKAGDKAWYVFDYETQDAIIMVPGKEQTLTEFAKEHNL